VYLYFELSGVGGWVDHGIGIMIKNTCVLHIEIDMHEKWRVEESIFLDRFRPYLNLDLHGGSIPRGKEIWYLGIIYPILYADQKNTRYAQS
jgi:hypothetical protein